MDATLQTESNSTSEFGKLTKNQKLAGLLLVLDAGNAANLMKELEESELEAVTAEMAKFTSISYELQQDILREFAPLVVDATTAITAGVERTKVLLEKSVGMFRATDIINRVAPQRPSVAAMKQIAEMDARQIFNVLRYEQLQTIALVISYLPPAKASQLLALVRPELLEQIIERLATLAPTSIEVVESVAEELQQKLSTNRTRALNQTGGVKVAAEVLNVLPKNLADSILLSLKERNPDLGDAVLKKMLTFEELERLDPKSLQKILQEVDMRNLAVALKTASESLKTVLLGCISKRARRNQPPRAAQIKPDRRRANGNHRDRPPARERRRH